MEISENIIKILLASKLRSVYYNYDYKNNKTIFY